MKSKDSDSRPYLPASPSQSWRDSLLTASDIERLVDRLSVTLQAQSQTVRELEATQRELDARQLELEQARDKAERASETLATFLKALGHDLRAPLVSVDAALQMLDLELRDGDTLAAASRVDEIRRTAAHGLSLIDDLFELIRSDAGQWRVEPQAVRISEIVADARAVVSPRAHLKRITVETRCVGHTTDAKHFVETDLVRIRQALVNLLSNAIKFSEHGPVVVEVERRAGDMLAFRVLDNGPGLDPDSIDAIFEPFTQGKRTSRHHKDGAGLGLAIVRRCARLLGGEVYAENRASGGAIFTLVIRAPRVEAPAADAALERAIEEAALQSVAQEVERQVEKQVEKKVAAKVVERMAERVAERVAEKLDLRAEPQRPSIKSIVEAGTPGAAAPVTAPAPAPIAVEAPAPAAPETTNTATNTATTANTSTDDFGALYRGPQQTPSKRNYGGKQQGHGKHHGHAKQHGHAAKAPPAAQSMHILVVDGSPDAASEISEHLKQMGLEAVCARTLAEARQLISQCRPDLIISERKLPDGSGLEFHDIAPGTRLVLSTSKPDPNEFPPGTRILAKPVNPRSMQEAVLFSLNRTVKFPT